MAARGAQVTVAYVNGETISARLITVSRIPATTGCIPMSISGRTSPHAGNGAAAFSAHGCSKSCIAASSGSRAGRMW